jgi:hypothetical protein
MKLFTFIFLFIALVANNVLAQDANSRGRSLTIPMISEAVVVDGEATEAFWGRIEATVFDTALVTTNGNLIAPDNDTDFSGNFKMCWDENNIYLLVTMKDQAIIQGVTTESDNIELFFNVDTTQHGRDGYNNLTASQVRMNVMNTDNLLTGGGYAITAGDMTNFKYITKVTTDGYVVEAQIPWVLVVPDAAVIPHPFTIAEGSIIEFEIQPADADDPDRLVSDKSRIRESILTWNGKNPNAWKDVDLLGNLILGGTISGLNSAPLIEKNRVVVYPSFTNTLLNIRIEDASKVKTIAILNFAGQSITEFAPNDNLTNVDVTNFNKGIYFVKVVGNNGSITTQKIIKY